MLNFQSISSTRHIDIKVTRNIISLSILVFSTSIFLCQVTVKLFRFLNSVIFPMQRHFARNSSFKQKMFHLSINLNIVSFE